MTFFFLGWAVYNAIVVNEITVLNMSVIKQDNVMIPQAQMVVFSNYTACN